MPTRKSRTCKICKEVCVSFFDALGSPNARGQFCGKCIERRLQQEEAALLDRESSYAEKFKVMFGRWWQHYAYPDAFMLTLYKERTDCPYCGRPLPSLFTNKTTGREHRPHIDHMDPISRGGEDSIRNAVYVCGQCNYAKRDKLFLDWLETLTPECQACARTVYIAKHSHAPEEFEPGEPQERAGGIGIELEWTVDEILLECPNPIVSGPPRAYLEKLLLRHFQQKPLQ